ncbi:rhomboid family intramembrane serine protease, partial [Staphylococcus aureus]|uniref:rhomboid family intramembrane serine protease n=1 Tax=Staphylococcus aureus TaxID=1280 RepID=UPI00351EA38F
GLQHFNVVHGDWYRIVNSMFLHFRFEHILLNMLLFYIFGKIRATSIGSWRLLLIYFMPGLLDSFVSLSFTPMNTFYFNFGLHCNYVS